MADEQIDYTVPAGAWSSGVGAPLDHNAARKILLERLGFKGSLDSLTNWQKGYKAPVWKDLGDALIKSLPEELRTDTVLRTLDLRTLLAPVMTTRHQAEQRGTVTINGQEFDEFMQGLAGGVFVDYQNQLRGQLETQVADTGLVPLNEVGVYADEMLRRWHDQPLGTLTPNEVIEGTAMTDPVTGQVQTVGANQTLNDFASATAALFESDDTATTVDATQFLTENDLRIMLQTDSPQTVIERYNADLSNRAGARAAGMEFVPADSTQVNFYKPGPTDLRGDVGAGREKVSYTLAQAIRLPAGWTRAEVTAMSEKMRKAGIYDQAGGEPTVKGDPFDPQFKRAYQLLLGKSLEANRPINQILDEQAIAYEELLNEEDRIRTRLSDPARLRISADALSREVLGRIATDTERAQLVEMIHNWERQEAVAAGPDGDDEVTDVDWQARMEETIREQNPGEAGAHDVAMQYDTFRGLLRGPGRGVST